MKLDDYMQEIGIKPVELDITDYILKNANIFIYDRDIFLTYHGLISFVIQFYIQNHEGLYPSITYVDEHELSHHFDFGNCYVDYSNTLIENRLTHEI